MIEINLLTENFGRDGAGYKGSYPFLTLVNYGGAMGLPWWVIVVHCRDFSYGHQWLPARYIPIASFRERLLRGVWRETKSSGVATAPGARAKHGP